MHLPQSQTAAATFFLVKPLKSLLVQGLISTAEYEEKKLKMRKAMGESLHDAPASEPEDSRQRRLNMIRCASQAAALVSALASAPCRLGSLQHCRLLCLLLCLSAHERSDLAIWRFCVLGGSV